MDNRRGFIFQSSYFLNFFLKKSINEHVTLVIYDLFGKEIAQLLNEEMTEGEYEVSWDSGDSPNGQYMVRIETPTFSDVKLISKIK